LQSRLHFRIHAAQTEIRAKIKAAKRSNSSDNGAAEDIDRKMLFEEEPGAIDEVAEEAVDASSFQIPMTEDDANNA
jgi:hypothetical protein